VGYRFAPKHEPGGEAAAREADEAVAAAVGDAAADEPLDPVGA
jgi:hypothetical protein